MSEQQIISVCAYCQKEFPKVEKAIQAAQTKYGISGEIAFSHGYCTRHFGDLLRSYGTPEQEVKKETDAMMAAGENTVPDLRERPDLVTAWSNSDFTKTEQNEDMAEKPMVRICSWCQKINDPQYAEQAAGLDTKVKEEMKEVDRKVKESENNFTFSHGICLPHTIQVYKAMPGMTEDRIKMVIQKAEQGNPPPCLITNEPLRHAFMKGLFTPEMIQQATKEKHRLQLEMRQRFKKLAGVRS